MQQCSVNCAIPLASTRSDPRKPTKLLLSRYQHDLSGELMGHNLPDKYGLQIEGTPRLTRLRDCEQRLHLLSEQIAPPHSIPKDMTGSFRRAFGLVVRGSPLSH